MLSVDAVTFLEKEGFSVLKSFLAASEDEATVRAAQIGFPVALKLSSPDVIHKTEADGIRVALRDAAEVRQAFREIVRSFTMGNLGKRLDGVMVQEQGSGASDRGMLTERSSARSHVRLGGIFVEAMKDVTFRLVPIERRDARRCWKS
jgi:acyl-CoA synthetase (NDP forming)